MNRSERLYGSVEEPYCFLCSRATDHYGEHSEAEELLFVAWEIVLAGSPDPLDEADHPDYVPNMREILVALKNTPPRQGASYGYYAPIKDAIRNLYENEEAYVSSGIVADIEYVLEVKV